ncbi:MAG: leucine-rich repeat domain-containing protein [Candidatus Ornithospirochaeta sp.]
MKRLIYVLLVMILVLVSCDTGNSDTGILSVRFETESSRAMTIKGKSIDPSEAVWTYRLTKEDGGFSIGETKERVLMGGTTLSVEIALGEWSIIIEGFKDDSFNEKVYYGKKSFILGACGLDVIVEVDTITDTSLLEGKNTADFIFLPISKDFNMGFFEGEERELCAVWTLDGEVIEEWTLIGEDIYWKRERGENISASGIVVRIPAGKGRKLEVAVADGLGTVVAKEGWEIDCSANCLYVVGGSITKRGESFELEIEINGNLPSSEGVVSPVTIKSIKDIDLSKWESFDNATGFIVGFEIGEPQVNPTYVEDLNRASCFPIYTTGTINYPVYYGDQTHINALLVKDVDALCKSGAQWAMFMANSGMTSDSPINYSLQEAVVARNKTEISPYMFRNCAGLSRLEFGSFTGDSIGDYAFENCSSLLEVPTNDNITRIGTGAFKGCTSLRSYTIGKATKYIGAEAFLDCNNTIIEFENKNSGGAWFVGPERIKVDPNILSSSTLKQYLTDTYANEYWEWKQIPNDWNWVDVYPCCASFTYEMNAERNGVQLYIDGEKSRVLYDGDHVIIISERVKVSVKFEDNLWKVFIDDELRGYFEYVTE